MNELIPEFVSLFATYDPTASTVGSRLVTIIAIAFYILLITKYGR